MDQIYICISVMYKRMGISAGSRYTCITYQKYQHGKNISSGPPPLPDQEEEEEVAYMVLLVVAWPPLTAELHVRR
jgi:hypothetical protein